MPPPVFHYGAPAATYTVSGPLAGFWIRFAALLLDSILYGLVIAPFAAVGAVLMVRAFDDCERWGDEIRCYGDQFDLGSFAGGVAIAGVGMLLVLVLYVRALARTGQPWGARIVGVKVVRTSTGATLGVGRALGRTLFAGFISGQVCYLGYLWAAWDDKKQTWHDKVVDSVVVKV